MRSKHDRTVDLVGVDFRRGETVETAAGTSVLKDHVRLALEFGERVLHGFEVQDLALRIVLPEPQWMAGQTGEGIAARQQIVVTRGVAWNMDEASEIKVA